MKYSDMQRIEKIYSTTGKLLAYLKESDITTRNVLEQETVRWTITTPLYNIGEHAYYLSDGFKEQYPDIPWAKIAGLRHRLVHNYDDTNWNLVGAVLFEVLPGFMENIGKILQASSGTDA